MTLQAPPAPGTYYYGACVDAVPGEAETTNNCVRDRRGDREAPRPPGPLAYGQRQHTGRRKRAFTLHATVVNRGSSRSQTAQPDVLPLHRRDRSQRTTRGWIADPVTRSGTARGQQRERHADRAVHSRDVLLRGLREESAPRDYCTEAVEVTAGDATAVASRSQERSVSCSSNSTFVRFTVTARVPLTSLAVSTYMVEGRTNTKHLVRRVEIGDLAANSSYSKLTSRLFFAHMRRDLTTCTASVEGYASVRPGFDPPPSTVPDPQPQPSPGQTPADQPQVGPTPVVPTYQATIALMADIHHFRYGQAVFDAHGSCGYSVNGVPCPWQDHISWWSSLPPHIQGCALTTGPGCPGWQRPEDSG